MTFVALGMAIGWFVHMVEQQDHPPKEKPKPPVDIEPEDVEELADRMEWSFNSVYWRRSVDRQVAKLKEIKT